MIVTIIATKKGQLQARIRDLLLKTQGVSCIYWLSSLQQYLDIAPALSPGIILFITDPEASFRKMSFDIAEAKVIFPVSQVILLDMDKPGRPACERIPENIDRYISGEENIDLIQAYISTLRYSS